MSIPDFYYASDIQPANLIALLNRAIALLMKDELYAAWRLLDRAERILPHTPVEIPLLLSKVFAEAGCLEHAYANAQKVLQYPHISLENAHYLLKRLASDVKSHADSLQKLAWQILGEEQEPYQLLPALKMLIRLNAQPIGVCHFDGELITGWLLNAPKLSALTVTIDGEDFTLKPYLETPFLAAHGLGCGQQGFSMRVPKTAYQHIRIHLNGVDLAGSPLRLRLSQQTVSAAQSAPNRQQAIEPCVDVIVPVYRGYAQTRACLQSVLQSSNRTPYQLMVVNDASPEPMLVKYLQGLAAKGKIILLEQAFNSGFVAAINKAVATHPQRDVLLLNADTLVQNNWLDRLHHAAYQAEKIGTVTPLTNNGELVSVPVAMRAAPMPSPALLQVLDNHCRLAHQDRLFDLPVGVGFCLYIKRRCLDEVGDFDSLFIQRGYGEDTDFCLRAKALGWQHVCATSVFVAHEGGVSFGAEKQELVAKNIPRIYQRYPTHSDEYEQFLTSDPLATMRRDLQRATLSFYAGKNATLVLLATCDAIPETENKQTAFYLRFDSDTIGLHYRDTQQRPLINLSYQWTAQRAQLTQDVSKARFKHIEIRDVADYPPDLLDDITGLGIPYRMVLRNDVVCCSGVACQPSAEQWAASLFSRAQAVMLPSQQLLQRYQARFPAQAFQLLKPCQYRQDGNTGRVGVKDRVLRIAVLEAISVEHGFVRVLELARAMTATNAPAELIVLGNSLDDAALLATRKAWVTGTARENEYPPLIQQHHCAMIVHAGSYASPNAHPVWLARHCGLPLAVFATSIFADDLNPAQGDRVLPVEASATQCLALLLNEFIYKASR